MFDIFLKNKLLTGIILSLLLLSIICQIIIGVIYQNLIKEAENITTTENKHLKLCKLKFANCYQMNGGVANISVFVDKFISRLKIGYISLGSMSHLSGQFIMLSIFVSGIGICMAIIGGETLLQVLPYYAISMIGLYLYFSVSGMVDIKGRKDTLKINLMDYLENHMLNRLENNEVEEIKLNEEDGIIKKAKIERKEKAVVKVVRQKQESKNRKETKGRNEALEKNNAVADYEAKNMLSRRNLDFVKEAGIKFNSKLADNIINIINNEEEKELDLPKNDGTTPKAVFAEEELENLLKELLV